MNTSMELGQMSVRGTRERALGTTRERLFVAREGIEFWTTSDGRVRLEIRVTNIGSAPSRPTALRLEAAAFGAFLPWRPMANLRVPVVPPGGHVVVSTSFERPPHVADFAQPPWNRLRTLLTAAGAGDAPGPEHRRPVDAPATLQTSILRRAASRLPVDELAGLLGPRTHWAGNFNVLVGKTATERHMARAVRIVPGRRNVAILALGACSERFEFSFRGAGAAWDPALYDVAGGRQLVADGATVHRFHGNSMLFLTVQPPEDAVLGRLEVLVRRLSPEAVAVVEFDLDARAEGPGCYTI